MGEVRDVSPALLLGRYRSEEVIGEGAFGRVVRAFDTRLKRTVAIKTLKRSLAQTDLGHFRQLEDRFIREAEAGARVGSHANLVTVYDLIEDDDRSLHLVLLYVSGGTIGERLAADGPFPLADALRLTADIARGLQAAHDAGIVHRDIKPANVFMATDGRAQVGDFGIAQLDHLSARTYAFVGHPGTPLYMSPEQSQTTGYVRPISDQYSTGLVLFEMLNGRPYKRLADREVAEYLGTLPSPVAALIERMTASDPDDRYRTMADVALAIRRIEQSLDLDMIAPVAPPPPNPYSVDAEAAYEPAERPANPVRPVFVPSDPPRAVLPERLPVAPPANAPPVGPLPTVRPGDASATFASARPARRSRGRVVAIISLLLALTVGGLVGASYLSGGRGGGLATATAPGSVAGGGNAPTAAPSATLAPTPASSLVAPLLTTATAAPPATVPPTPQPTITPSTAIAIPSTATTVPPTATAVPPTATPAPVLGVFGAGTTDRGDLQTLSPADAVDTFTVGQEVFAFVNYDGARPGVDSFEITLIANDTAQAPQSVPLAKSGGFVFVSLGQPAAGNYRIEVRHGGTLLPNQPTFQVKAPAPTAVPVVAPRATAATGGQAPASQPQPAAQPKAPTCVPGTC